jgi:hypothetical protein
MWSKLPEAYKVFMPTCDFPSGIAEGFGGKGKEMQPQESYCRYRGKDVWQSGSVHRGSQVVE